MATWRRRAALDAWIDQVDSLLHQDPCTTSVVGTGAGPAGGARPSDPALHPGPAERDRGWMSLHAG